MCACYIFLKSIHYWERALWQNCVLWVFAIVNDFEETIRISIWFVSCLLYDSYPPWSTFSLTLNALPTLNHSKINWKNLCENNKCPFAIAATVRPSSIFGFLLVLKIVIIAAHILHMHTFKKFTLLQDKSWNCVWLYALRSYPEKNNTAIATK